jgi:hypothetical protein
LNSTQQNRKKLVKSAKSAKRKAPIVHSDFWFDRSSKGIQDVDIQKLLAMSEIQRAIGNFVQIVSPKRIPVVFGGKNSFTDHSTITIASVKDKNFDSTCGLALHEASHIKYSSTPDERAKLIADYIDGRSKINGFFFRNYGLNVGIWTHRTNIQDLQNWIEDRRIDALVKQSSPGYVGYYEAMYDFYFRSDYINRVLASSKFRKADNLEHYFNRIINFLSPATDLDALPGLRLIWNKLDINDILRLKSSSDSFSLAAELYDIILSYVSKATQLRQQPKPKNQPKAKQQPRESKSESDGKGKSKKEKSSDGDDSNDGEEKPFDENSVDDSEDSRSEERPETNRNGDHKAEEDENDEENESDNKTSKVNLDDSEETEKSSDQKMEDEIQEALDSENEKDEDPISDKDLNRATNALNGQRNFLNEKIKKDSVSQKDNTQLDMLEKMKAKFIPVDCRDTKGNLIKIDVLSIEHIPSTLFDYDITSKRPIENQIFEKLGDNSIFNSIFTSHYAGEFDESTKYQVIESGIRLGKQLGTKLKIRTEERTLKTTRQAGGKIDRRIVHLAAAGVENLFCSLKTAQFNKAHLHVSIDGSGSMNGEKFDRALQTAAAICSAADVVKNIEVVVTIRTTTHATNISRKRSSRINKSTWPTVVTIYNSKKDKLSKILKVWPWLMANGSTPEAITYEAERELMPKGSMVTDVYFITLTDGGPGDTGVGKNQTDKKVGWYYGMQTGNDLSTGNIDAQAHTKFQINQMNKDGIATMAFFISAMLPEKIAAFNSASPEDMKELVKGCRSSRSSELEEKYGRCETLISFKKCYGKDGVITDSTNLIQLAHAMNVLFLRGNPFR